MEHSALDIDLEHPKHAQRVICGEIMEMRSQWDFFGCVKPAAASAVWVASLQVTNQVWSSLDWYRYTWTAIVRLVGRTGKFSETAAEMAQGHERTFV